MLENAYRVGLIGVGEIAGWHVRSLRAAGFEITAVGNRAGSKRTNEFALRQSIPRVFEDWRTMLQHSELWDALAICTWPDGTPDVLKAALKLKVPILVEKPVAWNSEGLRHLCELPHDQVIVGYNRRFYRSVHAAHAEAQRGPPLLAHLSLPMDVASPDQPDSTGGYLWNFFESISAHGLDLTRYVLGDLRVEEVRRLKNEHGNLIGLAALLSSQRGDIVQVTSSFGTSANFSLSLCRRGRRVELLPFEIASIYEGMEVVPPTKEYPVRRYIPKSVGQILLDGIDLQEKPGFVAEAQAFLQMISGQVPPACTARLEDALAAVSLCEDLTGVSLGNVHPNPFVC